MNEINVQLHLDYWLGNAQEDLNAAQSLFDKGSYVRATFFAELAVERLLKALVVKRTRQVPPYIHNLLRRVEIAELDLESDQLDILSEIQRYCIEGRYPAVLMERMERSVATKVIEECKKQVVLLRQILSTQ